MASTARWCCCGCPNGYPRLEVTVTFTGTPANVGYLAGPPATIGLYGKRWESGDTKLVCPDTYNYTPGTTGASTTNAGVFWRRPPTSGGNGLGGLYFSVFATLNATLPSLQYRTLNEAISTPGSGTAPSVSPAVFRHRWVKFANYATGLAINQKINLAAYTGHTSAVPTPLSTNDWAPPLTFGQFTGSMTTSNGITVSWQPSVEFP